MFIRVICELNHNIMENVHNGWYTITNIAEIDSPALVLYYERIKENILQAKAMCGRVEVLRPHVKTNKIAEVCRLMMEEGITKFKCATIAEAEMLGQIEAADVLLAYQPVGPKAQRLVAVMKEYPGTRFSCLVDNKDTAAALSQLAGSSGVQIDLWLDLNIGMNRTGILPGEEALALFEHCLALPDVHPVGLHAYDGHIKETDPARRQQQSDEAFAKAKILAHSIEARFHVRPTIVAGGSPTFSTHIHRSQVECSPGTFVFWDWGYKHQVPEQLFDYAALVITRVISVIDQHTICTDLGHKSVAAENPFPRVHFLNAPEATAIGQSEEHLVLKVADAGNFKMGDVLYGVPLHICPTVALYERAIVVKDNKAVDEWKVVARDRKINL
jgi:D-serine deaminase-like pyridoxal phosphate-dependent protein